MAKLTFKQLEFEDKGDFVRVSFHGLFYFDVDKKTLDSIGKFEITRENSGDKEGKKGSIVFIDVPEKRAWARFNIILDQGLGNLKSKIGNKKVIYVHQGSGIPLIGTNYFGLIDRGTNIIEIKPMNGCNLDCIFCSVDEGFSSKRPVDFLVEKDYLVNEFRKLAEFKKCDCIHAHIAGQGETLMYPEIVEFVRDIARIHFVKDISIITNGTLLTKHLIDELASAGLTRLNISLNSVDRGIADKLANMPYNVEKVMEMVEYASKKITVILVPVLLRGYNENEVSRIVELYKEIKAKGGNVRIGIQNFLNYRLGRNPVKQFEWDEFYGFLDGLEKRHGVNLRYIEDKLVDTKELPKPFKKGDVVKARIVCSGRLHNEMLAVANDRLISISNCHRKGDVSVRILRSKHNIFFGEFR